MTSLEYILKLFEVSAKQLHIDYVQETPTRFQKWATKNKPPYIALLGRTESSVTNNVNTKVKTYVCNFVVITSNERDLSNEDLINNKIYSDKLADDFSEFISKNKDIFDFNSTKSEVFREGSYVGSGVGITITLSIVDMNKYCDIFCNDSTKIIDCNS
tara:strand:+ start:42 stop:515 length:474 start_codon:yes stop_codon:yes gene_type:complete